MRAINALVGFVSRVPARVEIKLLTAFLAIEVLLIVMGAVSLGVLSGINQRTDELIKLQRKIEAYRQVQHDTTSQLYGVSAALLASDDLTLSSALRQLNQFGYDVDRLQFVAKDEVELLGPVPPGLRPLHQNRDRCGGTDPRRPRPGGAGDAGGAGGATGRPA